MRLGEEAFQDQSSRPLEWTPNSELSEIVRGATRQKVLTPEVCSALLTYSHFRALVQRVENGPTIITIVVLRVAPDTGGVALGPLLSHCRGCEGTNKCQAE